MADAVVSFVIERLGDYLIHEVVSLFEVRDEVEWLKHKLEWMQGFLLDAEEKQGDDHRIRKWVSDIRDAAYSAEDIVDDFILKINEGGAPKKAGFKGAPPRKVGFKASLKKYLCICSNESGVYKMSVLYTMGEQIDSLKKQLDEIHKNQKMFNIRSISNVGKRWTSHMNESMIKPRRKGPYANDEVVGFNKDAELLMLELDKEDRHRCLISIMGMGGLGKTTLAQKLYHSSLQKNNFHCYAWASVSQEYNTEDLLRRILKSFRKPSTKDELEMLEKMTEADLERHLHEFLEGCRYMVVLDDVWKPETWESLRSAFPDNGNGSRVIITTRDQKVAECPSERIFLYKLPFLEDKESWELFCKKAFPNYDDGGDVGCVQAASRCPASLEELGRDMVRRCRGLPLAIVVLGGLLERKPHDEWRDVRDHIWRHVRDGSVHVKQILALSFSALQPQLKMCFLYIGLYPEDYEIQTEKLLRLWVAEGFIQPSSEITLEEVAIEYLNELVGRNLIQVARRDWRRISKCRVHDLLRDLAIQRANELTFLHVYDKMIQYSAPLSNASTYRRLASQLGFERFVSSDYLYPLLRTLLVFNNEVESAKIDNVKFVLTKFRLLRVLDLNSIRFARSQSSARIKLPDAVGNLIHLRYLGLTNTDIEELPQSIGHLRALQTIDALSHEVPLLLPNEICNAKQLRHLIGFNISWPLRVDNLTNLQKLKTVYVRNQMDFDPMNLINLQELQVSCTCEEQGMAFTLDSIGKLKSLRTFTLEVARGATYFPDLELLTCQTLLQLRLVGVIQSIPTEMHELLPNLRYLDLEGSKLKEDPMPKLEKLPSLTILDLRGFKGEKLACTTPGGFSQLQVLQLDHCFVKELRVDEGGMPALIGFRVVPEGRIKISQRFMSIPLPQNWTEASALTDTWPY